MRRCTTLPSVDGPTQIVSWTVAEHHAKVRLDAYLVLQLPWRSRRSLSALVDSQAARVNDKPAKKSHRLAPGDLVQLEVPDVDRERGAVAAVALPILFEDEDLVVVDKPPGLPVHPASTCLHVHALGRLALRYQRERVDPTAEPSVIHRLDRMTSGVIAFARRRALVGFYAQQFERRTVRKEYVAIVHGHPPEVGRIEHPLVTVDRQPVRVGAEGKASVTEYRVLGRAAGCSMLRIKLHTGRKHQIRVHLAADAFPLVYDGVYGDEQGREGWPAHARTMLHAAQLQLTHRVHGPMSFEAPLPEDMTSTWDSAGGALAEGGG